LFYIFESLRLSLFFIQKKSVAKEMKKRAVLSPRGSAECLRGNEQTSRAGRGALFRVFSRTYKADKSCKDFCLFCNFFLKEKSY